MASPDLPKGSRSRADCCSVNRPFRNRLLRPPRIVDCTMFRKLAANINEPQVRENAVETDVPVLHDIHGFAAIVVLGRILSSLVTQ